MRFSETNVPVGLFGVGWVWMKSSAHGPIAIPPEIAAKCDGPNQFETFDRGVRAFLSVPKSAVLKDEARTKRQKKRTKK
jgi:hypothetical protein